MSENGDAPQVEEEPVEAAGYDIPGAAEAPQQPPLGSPENPIHGRTSFIVVVDLEGGATAYGDASINVEVERPATLEDMWRACSEVLRDIEESKTAAHTVALLQQMTMQAQQAMMEAQQAQKIRQALAKKGVQADLGPGGIPLLGR